MESLIPITPPTSKLAFNHLQSKLLHMLDIFWRMCMDHYLKILLMISKQGGIHTELGITK